MGAMTQPIGDLYRVDLTDKQKMILDCAATIFAKKGFADTDVQVVADAAKVGKGTVYRNFATKEGLFLATVDREMRQLVSELTEVSKSHVEPLDRITVTIRAYFSFFDRRPWAVELLIMERAEFKDRKQSTYIRYKEEMREYWESITAELCEREIFRQKSPRRIFEFISDVVYGTIFTNHFADRHESYEEQAETIIDELLYGLIHADRHQEANLSRRADG